MRKFLRTKKRIQRDRLCNQPKRDAEADEYTFDKVFTYNHFVKALRKCRKGVFWKYSVQNYWAYGLVKTYRSYLKLINKELPKATNCRSIYIYERGKKRTITPIHINDRVIQKVLCDYCLTPLLKKKLIYDNGASLEGKGINFSRKRLNKHLKDAIKEYGTDFYILLFDFKSYFDTIPHSTCRKVLEKYIQDKDIVEITMEIIKEPLRCKYNKFKNDEKRNKYLSDLKNDKMCGICLGSQVSQIMALIIANDLDHYIKDKKRVKHYIRYMDDGIIFAKTKEELNELLYELNTVCETIGISFNKKKTHIIKSSKGFTFLKIKYNISKTGKIIKRISRPSIVRMRRKLKKYHNKINQGDMVIKNAFDSMQSWIAYASSANSYNTVNNMLILYRSLFGISEMKKLINKKGGQYGILQTDRFSNYRWSNRF